MNAVVFVTKTTKPELIMKIVHTFWSCNLPSADALLQHAAGWRESKYHYMGWALSCLLARRQYDQVELVTDEIGKQVLIDRLELPYTSVRVVLDAPMANYQSSLWALPKLIAYQLQQEPFLHIDGDVFLYKPFSRVLEEAPLVSQNIEKNFPIYHEAIDVIQAHFEMVPNDILQDRRNNTAIYAANTGLFGGHDFTFIQDYVAEAFRFVDQNRAYWNQVNSIYFNCVFEQYLLYCMAENRQKPMAYFWNDVNSFEEYWPIARYMGKSNEFGYSHPIGPFKKHPLCCKYVAKGLARESRKHYQRIERLYPKPASRWSFFAPRKQPVTVS